MGRSWRYRPSTHLCRLKVTCGSRSMICAFAAAPRRPCARVMRPGRSEIVVVEDAGLAALVDVLAQDLVALLELDGELPVELGVERMQRDDVDDVLFARDEDRVVLDSAHAEADEIDDRKILRAVAGPGRDVAVVGRVGEAVHHAQVVGAGAGRLLLEDDLRGEELRAALAAACDQLVDLLVRVGLEGAHVLDVLLERRELDQAGMAQRDLLFVGERRGGGERRARDEHRGDKAPQRGGTRVHGISLSMSRRNAPGAMTCYPWARRTAMKYFTAVPRRATLGHPATMPAGFSGSAAGSVFSGGRERTITSWPVEHDRQNREHA